MRSCPARPSHIASLLAVLLTALPLPSQQTAPTPQNIEDSLHQMSDLAAVIFVGQVAAVRHHPGEDGASGVVEIDFQVDLAIRGCSTGTYTLREWAGLWESSDERYLPGQTLLMMLHPANAAGISSPVGGMNGAMPIRAGGSAPAIVPATTAPPPPIVDLRWVGTRLLRTIPYAPVSASTLATGQIAAPPPASISDTSTAAQQANVSTVVGMLSSWQQSSDDLQQSSGARQLNPEGQPSAQQAAP